MKYKRKFIITIFVMIILSLFVLIFNKTYLKQKSNIQNATQNTISYMIETEANSGNYETLTSNKWPKEGYIFNDEMSYCVNGGTLSWDKSTNAVSLATAKMDKCYLYFDKELPPSEKTLVALGLSAKEGSPDFNTTATTDETADGLYAMEDDYGTSYYFRGAVENNYVYFAGYYWRIIRINGDGSLRIIYDGTIAHANGESSKDRLVSTSVIFNSSSNDNAYVGYMYGTAGSSSYEETHANINDSTIKTYVDNWYKTNIVDKGYAEAVSDEIFCNDRELNSGTGIGTTSTYYKASNRLETNKSPQLTCTQKNDAFTVNDEEKGNGALTYPVGLITADEIVLAGGKAFTSNSSYYLYKGSSYYWSLTPAIYSSFADVYDIFMAGYLYATGVHNAYGAVPVINLSASYAQNLVGDGTMDSPYTAP